jgi:hypothetical protein
MWGIPTPAEAVSRCGGTWPLTAPEPDCCRQELARAADAHHAAGTRRVSATRIAPNSGRIVTQIQSGGPRPDSPVRVLYAQPGSPAFAGHVLLARICATFPRVMQTTASLCPAFFSVQVTFPEFCAPVSGRWFLISVSWRERLSSKSHEMGSIAERF